MEALAAAFGFAVTRVLAGQEAARQRTPDHRPQSEVAHRREDLLLQVPTDERVIHLRGAEPLGLLSSFSITCRLQSAFIMNRKCLYDVCSRNRLIAPQGLALVWCAISI
jgi:hypothetical protein